jgi:hypothetical protein
VRHCERRGVVVEASAARERSHLAEPLPFHHWSAGGRPPASERSGLSRNADVKGAETPLPVWSNGAHVNPSRKKGLTLHRAGRRANAASSSMTRSLIGSCRVVLSATLQSLRESGFKN